MLARILAAFALFTGLASIGVPGEARLLAAYSQPSESTTQGSQGSQQAPCTADRQKPGTASRLENDPGCRGRRPVIIYMPTVQLGSDLALE